MLLPWPPTNLRRLPRFSWWPVGLLRTWAWLVLRDPVMLIRDTGWSPIREQEWDKRSFTCISICSADAHWAGLRDDLAGNRSRLGAVA